MQVLSVISRLMDYPDSDVQASEKDMLEIVAQSELTADQKTAIESFLQTNLKKDLLDWQSEYGAQFERGRSLGLWLFEHVHGESRDRGQAMVDLVNVYREAGLEISQHELPDYIPMFLEFLATQGKENAQGWIKDVEHILGVLLCRLQKRESDYAILFDAVLTLGGSTVDLNEIRARISDEKRDDTKQALDKEWEEEEVTFGAESLDKACESSARKPSESQRRDLDIPINWVDFDAGAAKTDQRVEGM